ncbi:sensor histidine kinase, partial [Psychrobacter sp. 1U2]
MKSAFRTINVIFQTLKQDNTLPVSQLRKLGIIYNGYRLVVSAFLLLMAYANIKADTDLLLLSLLQQTALGFYVILSLILLSLFLVATKQLQRQLVFGLGIDVIVL